jgi:hypothetical protein
MKWHVFPQNSQEQMLQTRLQLVFAVSASPAYTLQALQSTLPHSPPNQKKQADVHQRWVDDGLRLRTLAQLHCQVEMKGDIVWSWEGTDEDQAAQNWVNIQAKK